MNTDLVSNDVPRGADNAVNFVGMELPIAYIGGGVIVAIMFLPVFVGGANAGDCSRSQSAEATTEEVKSTDDKKAEVEA